MLDISGRFYSILEHIRYRLRKVKVYYYRNARSINSILHGHNVLFTNVLLDGCELGEYTYVQKNTILVKTKVGKFCSIADNVQTGFGSHPTDAFVSTHPLFFNDTTNTLKYTWHHGKSLYNAMNYAKGDDFLVLIGNDVWIGSHVLIMDGVSIGDGAVIAAGAVVTKDVAPYSIVGGIPAKEIRKRFTDAQRNFLMENKWWDKPVSEIAADYLSYKDIVEFCKIK